MPVPAPASLDEETEVEMMLRIEAEERARLEDEFNEAQVLQPTKSSSGGAPSRSGGSGTSTGRMMPAAMAESCSCSAAGGPTSADLLTIAKRFGWLGLTTFGGAPAQVAQMKSQSWRPEVIDDAALASLYALTQCLPGLSSAQFATALGVLQGGPAGGVVGLCAFSLAGTASLGGLGCLFGGAGEGVGAGGLGHVGGISAALLLSLRMGLSACSVALVAKSSMQLVTAFARDPMTKALCVGSASLLVYAPSASWVPPCAVAACGAATAMIKRLLTISPSIK